MELTAEEMKQLQDDVREIKLALIGNKNMNQKGLVHLVEANKNYIERDQKFKAKAVGALAVVQLLATTVIGWVLSKN